MSRFVSRRNFLAGLGVGAGFLPLLGSEMARAQSGIPKRLLVVTWTNGMRMGSWRPSGGETNFTLGPVLAPFEKLKSKLTVIEGLGQRVQYEANPSAVGWKHTEWYGGHDSFPAVLTGHPLSQYGDFLGVSGGDSIDQYIAQKLAAPTPFDSLVVGPWSSGGYYGATSYRGKSTGITPEFDPFNLFKTLFSGRNLPKGEFDKARATRKSVLDYLDGSLTAFGSRMGTEDKAKIDSHLEAVRAIEKQLAGGDMTLSCTAPTLPNQFSTSGEDSSNYPKALTAFSDLLVAAFRCDLTRVASLTLSDAGGDNLVFSWLGQEFTGPGDEYPVRQYHDITHRAEQSDDHRRRKDAVEAYFHGEIAKIAQQLEDTREGTGTMLDNTLIVITNSMGVNHESRQVPFTLVGNLDRYFNTGRNLKYGNGSLGVAHNQLFVAVANAMGVDGAGFGLPEYNTELPGLKV